MASAPVVNAPDVPFTNQVVSVAEQNYFISADYGIAAMVEHLYAEFAKSYVTSIPEFLPFLYAGGVYLALIETYRATAVVMAPAVLTTAVVETLGPGFAQVVAGALLPSRLCGCTDNHRQHHYE